MKRTKLWLITIVLFTLWGCEKDKVRKDWEHIPFSIDSEHGIILYNGGKEQYKINNNELNIEGIELSINTDDEVLIKGYSYDVEFEDQNYQLYYTDLPIVNIDTRGKDIKDEPKNFAVLKILERDNPIFLHTMGIEVRGGFSQTFEKKSYLFELWNDDLGEEDEKEPILSMPKSDDWLMDGLWNEPLRIRDFVAHDLWLSFGRAESVTLNNGSPGIKRKYCEVFINHTYRGIYYLGENVDPQQLGIDNIKDPNATYELYKGYTWDDGVLFKSAKSFSNKSDKWSGYEMKHLKGNRKIDWSPLHNFVKFVVESDDDSFNSEIEKWADLDNLVDYFIFLNIMVAMDNVGKNIYTFKAEENGKYCFIPWDFDGSFGNDWQGERIDVDDVLLSNNLYDRLKKYDVFKNAVINRWNDLKQNQLNLNLVQNIFRKYYNILETNGCYHRETLVKGLEQNYSKTEIDYIENWLERRYYHLDILFENM